MYSFSKTRHDANWREFKQKNFQRGRKDLLPLIKRKTQMSHRSGGQASAYVDAEPVRVQYGHITSSPNHPASALTQEGEGSDVEAASRCACAADVELLKTRVGTLETQLWVMTDKYNEVLRYINNERRDRGFSTGSSTTGGHDDNGSTASVGTPPPEQDSDSCATSDAVEVTSNDLSKSALSRPDSGSSKGPDLSVRHASIDSATTVESVDASASKSARATTRSRNSATSIISCCDGSSSISANSSSSSRRSSCSGDHNDSNNFINSSSTDSIGLKKEGLNAIAEVAQFMEIRKQRGKVSLESFMEDAAVLAAHSLVGMDGAGDDTSNSSGSAVSGDFGLSSSSNSDKEGPTESRLKWSSIEAQASRSSSIPDTAYGSHNDADILSPRKKTRSMVRLPTASVSTFAFE